MFAGCSHSNKRSGLSYVFVTFARLNKHLFFFSLHLTSACKWNNRTCKLFLHYEHGFTLYSDPTDSVFNGGTPTAATGNVRLLWQQPFEKLRSSADDNEHLLTLDFHGEEGVVVRRPIDQSIEEIFAFPSFRNWISVHLPNRLSSIYTHFYQLKLLGSD